MNIVHSQLLYIIILWGLMFSKVIFSVVFLNIVLAAATCINAVLSANAAMLKAPHKINSATSQQWSPQCNAT